MAVRNPPLICSMLVCEAVAPDIVRDARLSCLSGTLNTFKVSCVFKHRATSHASSSERHVNSDALN